MFALDYLSRLFFWARGMFALVGVTAVLAVTLPGPHGPLLARVAAQAGPADTPPAAALQVPSAVPAEAVRTAGVPVPMVSGATREQQAIAEFIGRRYRVADAASHAFVTAAYRAGREHSVDPLLILAVMAIESRYNPVAESSMGAKGLMQVIPRYHPEKLVEHGGEDALLDPEVNILVGTQVLREYLGRLGEVEAALQKYNGALDEPTSQYASKVLSEKGRLERIVARSRREA